MGSRVGEGWEGRAGQRKAGRVASSPAGIRGSQSRELLRQQADRLDCGQAESQLPPAPHPTPNASHPEDTAPGPHPAPASPPPTHTLPPLE